MSDVASVLLSPLLSLLGTFQKERHYKDEKKDSALLAISNALTETKKYIEFNNGEKCADREQEYKLSQLWADAAVKSRYAAGDLAQRLQDKSLYWADNFEWSRDEVLERKIDLESVEKQVQELLKQS